MPQLNTTISTPTHDKLTELVTRFDYTKRVATELAIQAFYEKEINKMEPTYSAGQTIHLRTQRIECADGICRTVYYPPWEGLLTCEGFSDVTLTEDEAYCLNTYGRFIR